jgi:hypothetical protein
MLALNTNIPTAYSPASILSVFGIIYIILSLFLVAKQGGLRAGGTLLTFACVGALLVHLMSPGINPDHLPDPDSGMALCVICEDDNGGYYWGNLVYTVRAEEKWRFKNPHNTFDSFDDYRVDPQPQILAMHNPAFEGYISPRLYHPAAWFWSPLLIGVVGIIGWLFTLGAKRQNFQ